ncbi:hypothetical protein T440DRAFT_529298 [Plenodomus tracheiphilus IPT5]|uniref:Uncharacterized protein n=1 Tax=Plenodomus tracheiphilus IPT5 TaxID=1408161 RepID=A0A6A7BA62_9PLEO|nr:hypothetical protein T440DRAFT_529298 [Plenodomus tracheiphilus IPT5]
MPSSRAVTGSRFHREFDTTGCMRNASGLDPPPKSKAGRPETPEEEARLLQLHEVQKLKYADIAKILGRTTKAISGHMHAMHTRNDKPKPTNKAATSKSTRPEQKYATVDWTEEIDSTILNKHRNCQANTDIAASLHLPIESTQERWAYLLSNNNFPNGVLALDLRRSLRRSHKEKEVFWTRDEDEVIWALWTSVVNDPEILRYFPFTGKTATEIKTLKDEGKGEMKMEDVKSWVAPEDKAGGVNEALVKHELKQEVVDASQSEEEYVMQDLKLDKDGIPEPEWKITMGDDYYRWRG